MCQLSFASKRCDCQCSHRDKKMNKPFKPGQKAPTSGQYEIRGPRGGNTGGNERTVTRGEPLPPTPKPGQTYTLVDPTKHGGKK